MDKNSAGKADLMTMPDIAHFLDQCRQVQAQAASLCQDNSGLSGPARDALKDLRLSLLKARKLLGPSGEAAEATSDGSPERVQRSA